MEGGVFCHHALDQPDTINTSLASFFAGGRFLWNLFISVNPGFAVVRLVCFWVPEDTSLCARALLRCRLLVT